MAYVPNASDTNQPTGDKAVASAAPEFRTLKAFVAAVKTAQDGFQAQLTALYAAIGAGTDSTALAAALASPTGSSLVGYNLGAIGAITRPIQFRIREYATLKDFGAVGNGIADDTAAFQAAILWATTTVGRCIHAVSGTYIISSAVVKGNSFIGLNMLGDGMDSTVFKFTTGAGLIIHGGSGSLCYAAVKDCGFVGLNTTTLVEIEGQCGQDFVNCRFDTAAQGLVLHNGAAGSFTEFCVARHCDFTANCLLHLRYKLTAGNDSFHGSGLGDRCTINSGISGVSVQVDNGCRPYNSPMDVHIWGNSNCILIQNLNTAKRITFHGCITTERFSGFITLGTANLGMEMPLVGGVMGNNENVKFGQLYTCESAFITSGERLQTIGGRYSKVQSMVPGANIITGVPYSMAGSGLTARLYLVGANYGLVYKLDYGNSMGGFGSAPAALSLAFNNTAGYGAPSCSVNNSQQLIITNPNFPASGVTLFLDVEQVGQNPDFPFMSAN